MHTLTLTVELQDVALASEILNDDPYFHVLARPYSDVWDMISNDPEVILETEEVLNQILTQHHVGHEILVDVEEFDIEED